MTRTESFKESPQLRMIEKSLNFAGWTCPACKALNTDYTESTVEETKGAYAATGVKTISSGTLRTACANCGAAKP